jgi:hypothetical protein
MTSPGCRCWRLKQSCIVPSQRLQRELFLLMTTRTQNRKEKSKRLKETIPYRLQHWFNVISLIRIEKSPFSRLREGKTMLTLFQCKSVLTYNQSLCLHVVPESQGDAACQDGFLAFPANQQHKAPRVSSINNVFLRGIHSACTLIHWPHVHFWEFDSRSTNQSSFEDMELTWRTSLWSTCMGLPSPPEGASGLEVSTNIFGGRPLSCFGLSHRWGQSHRGLPQLHQSHLLTQTSIQINTIF